MVGCRIEAVFSGASILRGAGVFKIVSGDRTGAAMVQTNP
jgi:hypothetical protein